MLSQFAMQSILGIKEKVHLTSENMAKHMVVTFYPHKHGVSESILKAEQTLRRKLKSLGVREVEYQNTFTKVEFAKRFRRLVKLSINNILFLCNRVVGIKSKRFFLDFKTILNLTAKYKYKQGICIVVSGILPAHDLPMQYIKSFKQNSIISILDFPRNIDEHSTFEHHFDTSMNMFAYHMSNIVLAVEDHRWMIYNFNASHPIFNPNDESMLNHYILRGLIPKVVAPISPHTLRDFIILPNRFSVNKYKDLIEDLQKGAEMYAQTNLFPAGKKIDELTFRNNLHRQIGKLHLDSRSGMSFGFIAKQVPTYISKAKIISLEEKNNLYPDVSDFRVSPDSKTTYILCEVKNKLIEVEVPEVWVLTLRSGADKTHFDPDKDLLKLGLKNGQMYIQAPEKATLDLNYKPSFDTKVILAHAVGNSISSAIAELFNADKEFVEAMKTEGCSISHWHGYFSEEKIPPGVTQYGKQNPHVACSSPQSAIYALDGKLANFRSNFEAGHTYKGDIHVEPHHGSNICYPNLQNLVKYIIENKDSVSLGNKYL